MGKWMDKGEEGVQGPQKAVVWSASDTHIIVALFLKWHNGYLVFKFKAMYIKM